MEGETNIVPLPKLELRKYQSGKVEQIHRVSNISQIYLEIFQELKTENVGEKISNMKLHPTLTLFIEDLSKHIQNLADYEASIKQNKKLSSSGEETLHKAMTCLADAGQFASENNISIPDEKRPSAKIINLHQK